MRSSRVVWIVLVALGPLAEAAPEPLAADVRGRLRVALTSPAHADHRRAAARIEALGVRAHVLAPDLVALLADPCGPDAARALGALGAAATPHLLQALHGTPRETLRALEALEALGSSAVAAGPALSALFRTAFAAEVRAQAFAALCAVGGPAAEQALSEALDDPLRQRAAFAALGRSPSGRRVRRAWVAHVTRTPGSEHRLAAAALAVEVGLDDALVRRLIAAALRDPQAPILRVLIALQARGTRAAWALPALLARHRDCTEQEPLGLSLTLGRLAPGSAHEAPAVAALYRAVHLGDAERRGSAAFALRHFDLARRPEVRDALRALRDDPNPVVAVLAEQVLAEQRQRTAGAHAAPALLDADEHELASARLGLPHTQPRSRHQAHDR